MTFGTARHKIFFQDWGEKGYLKLGCNPMNLEGPVSHKTHFHIRWSSTSRLDWKPFPTREEAEELAKILVRPDETYAIEELNGNCSRCAASKMGERIPRNAERNPR